MVVMGLGFDVHIISHGLVVENGRLFIVDTTLFCDKEVLMAIVWTCECIACSSLIFIGSLFA